VSDDTPDPAVLDAEARESLRRRVAAFVDTKLLLGYRYDDCVYGAPSMEDANAIQGQAANEFGQANHVVTALESLGVDTDAFLARSDPAGYASMDVLDEAPGSWPAFLATVGLADLGTQARLTAFSRGEWSPLSEPAGKAVQEEEFHAQYLLGAVESYVAGREAAEAAFAEAAGRAIPRVLAWYGPGDETAATVVDAGFVGHTPGEQRRLFVRQAADLLGDALPGVLPDLEAAAADDDPGRLLSALGEDPWADWDDERSRLGGGAPDAEAIDALAIGGMEAAFSAPSEGA
jgi:1,2-phenylacetyl-CoA epoxidase catalytic subunit